jgi:modification methylase
MDIGYWMLNDVVWIKNNPMPQMKGVRLCNAHETLLWAKKSKEATGYTYRYKDFKAGNEDKQLRSDWYFPICAGRERETTGDGTKAHSTQKPEALLFRIIAACSNPGDLVLDPFCGSGTTAAVAKALGRDFITIDKEADYVDVARKRVAKVTPYEITEAGMSIDQPKPRIPFVNLVEGGALPPGTRLSLKGREVEAVVHEDGTISANGYRGSIHKVGKLVLGLPACNGWEHWLYTEKESGRKRLIDDLRPSEKPNALSGAPNLPNICTTKRPDQGALLE